MVEMHVPNKSYDGYYGGVKFTRGVGIFEDEKSARELANRYGYEIVAIGEKKEVKEEVVEVAEEVKPAPKKRPRKKVEKAGE